MRVLRTLMSGALFLLIITHHKPDHVKGDIFFSPKTQLSFKNIN